MAACCAAIGVAIAALLRVLDLNPLPFSQLLGPRTAFTIFVWLYLSAILLGIGSRFEVIAIATIPFLAQFYQIALGRDIAEGASFLRMMPYIVMAAAMLGAVSRREWRPTFKEAMAFTVVGIIAVLGVVGGIHLTSAGFPAAFYVAVLLPLFYAYIESLAATARPRLDELLLGLTLGAFLLMAGVFVTLRLGLLVETALGFGSSASAMQAADFNSVAGYLLLLWPFALAFAAPRSRLLMVVLLVFFVATMFAGLSKTMLLLAPVLVLASLPAYVRRVTFKDALSFMVVASFVGVTGLWLLSRLRATSETLYRWGQRLDIVGMDLASLSVADIVSSVMPGSRAQEDRALIREQGWSMFRDSPVVGQGWSTFPFFSSVEHTSAHSLTVDVLSQAGLLGGLLFWSLVVIVLFRMARTVVRPGINARLLVAFGTAFMLWLVAAHTVGAQMFYASETGFTTGAVNGVLFVLFLSRHTMNSVITASAARS
jgi:hypothetical protein